MINKETTEEYLRTSIGTTIVHRGTYDEIYPILKDRKFQSERFISFSDGIPFLPMHGDSYIIFNKENMVRKKNF